MIDVIEFSVPGHVVVSILEIGLDDEAVERICEIALSERMCTVEQVNA